MSPKNYRAEQDALYQCSRHYGKVDCCDGSAEDPRSQYLHDRDRVLYSQAFRRLGGVTQTAGTEELHLLHNRLTHSLKASQVAYSIAERLRISQPDLFDRLQMDSRVVETGALAHDLGHPPFGHVAEDELSRLAQGHGGFEGNAQTFRIVTALSKVTFEAGETPKTAHGLDLTRASLNALLKDPLLIKQKGKTGYAPEDPSHPPWYERSWAEKRGVYSVDKTEFEWARDGIPDELCHRRTPEAIIVDWADDITYAVHDIQDFFRAGVIPLDRPKYRRDEFVGYVGAKLSKKWEHRSRFDNSELARVIGNVRRARSFNTPYMGTMTEDAALSRWASVLLTRCIGAVSLVEKPPFILIEGQEQYEVEVLKQLTWFCVIDSPALAVAQQGHRRIIRTVFEVLVESGMDFLSEKQPKSRLPARLVEYLELSRSAISAEDQTVATRATADFLCGLTERQVCDLYRRISGSIDGGTLGYWIV